MKVHILKKDMETIEKMLNEKKIKFKRQIESKQKKYKSYEYQKLPYYTYNENLVNNLVVYEIKEWKEEYYSLFGVKESRKQYIHYGDYINFRKGMELPKVEIDETILKPKYPIYVISYQRYKTFWTIKSLEEMDIKYFIVIKEREYEDYKSSLERHNYKNYEIIAMSEEFERQQNELNNHGGIPQRNKCWSHAKENGFTSHWIVDDNIDGFFIYHKQRRVPFNHYSFFTHLENFRDSIVEPIGLLSPNYTWDFPEIDHRVPFTVNTKNYSCILVNHELLERKNIVWRKTYNEDVRLTLDCLMNRIRTIGMNQFLIKKMRTGQCKGGNEEIYKKHTLDGFKLKYDEIKEEYPKYISSITKHKDGRSHHKLNLKEFDSFKNITFIS